MPRPGASPPRRMTPRPRGAHGPAALPVLCVGLVMLFFHLGNAHMLPLLGQSAVARFAINGAAYTAATVVIAQGTMILVALQAARLGQDTVFMRDFEYAKDKVLMGRERRSLILSDEEKRITAYHEGGHALAARLLPGSDPVHKVTIIPRGRALGLTMQLPEEDRHGYSRNYLRNNLVVLLGGRVAESLMLDDISTGASNDIERATKIARAMVTKYGMSEKLGTIAYGSDDSNPFLGKEMGHISNYSEQTASEIDEEIQSIISTAYQKTEKILTDHIDELHRLAGVLYEKEKIDGVEFQQVMDGNLLPSGMAAQALGQEPQAALPEDGAQPQEGGSASQQDQD